MISQVLDCFYKSTQCDNTSYQVGSSSASCVTLSCLFRQAWHEWAVMNFRVVSHYSQGRAVRCTSLLVVLIAL